MNRIVQTRFVPLAALLIALLFSAIAAHAQTTQFTYQGRLTDGGSPANGSYDVQVKLFDALTGGNQIGATNALNGVAVSSGVFTVTLDFGAGAFPGANRWAEISARPAGNGAFTTLTPRQPVTSTPYAIKSLSAGAADSLSVSCNGCVTGSQIGSLPATSGNYIQNTTTQQANGNFNISGSGIVGGDAGIGGNLLFAQGGNKTISVATTTTNSDGNNLTIAAGTAQQSGQFARNGGNLFLTGGRAYSQTPFNAGGSVFISPGIGGFVSGNVILGHDGTTARGNVGIGTNEPSDRLHVAGRVRITGAGNGLVFPDGSLQTTAATGGGGSITGVTAGTGLTGGGTTGNVTLNLSQAFTDGLYVRKTGDLMTGGLTVQNGGGYGFVHTAGGIDVGSYVDGSGGWLGTRSSHPLHFFTADSNPLMTLGVNGNFGIGTTTPAAKLHVYGAQAALIENPAANSTAELDIKNDKRGYSLGVTAALDNAFTIYDLTAGGTSHRLVINTAGNVGIGATNPVAKLSVRGSESTQDGFGGAINLSNTAPGGANWYMRVGATGTSTPAGAFSLANDAIYAFVVDNAGNTAIGVGTTPISDKLRVGGDIRIGVGTTGCVKDADGTVIAGTCSSDLRFKKDVTPFANMLDKVTRLQPVYFNWRASEFPNKHFGNSQSFGLIAQEVEAVLPELVTKDEQGFRAVNYSKLPLLTIQAVKELKAENEALKQQNAALETRLEALEQMMQQLTGQQVKQPKQ